MHRRTEKGAARLPSVVSVDTLLLLPRLPGFLRSGYRFIASLDVDLQPRGALLVSILIMIRANTYNDSIFNYI